MMTFPILSVVMVFIVAVIAVWLLREDVVAGNRRLLVIGFFAIYLAFGLSVFRDYGVSVDEIRQRTHGVVALKHVISTFKPEMAEVLLPGVPALSKYPHRLYGVAFHLPLMGMEMVVGPGDQQRELWYFRHLYTFLFFYLGVIALYRLVSHKCGWGYGLLVAFLLVTTPRLFSESFYNIKDTTFLAGFSIALLCGFRFWRNPTLLSALLAGATAGFATNIRVVGVVLIPVVVALGALNLVVNRQRSFSFSLVGALRCFCLMSLLLASFYGVVVATAPVSWASPAHYLIDALRNFSDYRKWNGTFLYLGNEIRGRHVPWHYVPVSMLITIPLPVLVLFAGGVLAIARDVVTGLVRLVPLQRSRNSSERRLGTLRDILGGELPENVAFLSLLALPILAAIVRKSTLYSGWRHFTFTYSCILIIGAVGLKRGIDWYRGRSPREVKPRPFWVYLLPPVLAPSLLGSLLIVHLSTVVWMFVYHPFHIAYFNPLVHLFGGPEHFDRDYMRASYLPALKMIASLSPENQVKVMALNRGSQVPWLRMNRLFLDDLDIGRIQPVSDELKADIIIDTYRVFNKRFSPEARRAALLGEVAPDGVSLFSIYRVSKLRDMISRQDEKGAPWLHLNTPPFFVAGTPVFSNPVPINFDWEKGFRATTIRIRVPRETMTLVAGKEIKIVIGQSVPKSNRNRAVASCKRGEARRVSALPGASFEWLYRIDEEDLDQKGEFACSFRFAEPIYTHGVEIRPVPDGQIVQNKRYPA